MTESAPPLREASADALYHGLVEFPDGTARIGVVRRPTRAVLAVVDENRPELGPPESLLDEFTAERDDLKMRGLCEEGAHNAAWENVSFDRRYADYLDASEAAREALADLRRRRDDGEELALVGESGEKKRSHRAILRERL
ncbi:DUF488 family protein [Haloplanus sp. GCM10025708]|uniref:DUF488 family protein, N3 subclade n=1 Tax=Haloferacaceae TaxID=1644056 RepID=UPI0036071916